MLNRAGVSTHLFALGTEYMNISCIGVPSGLSSGKCNYYPVFDPDAQQRLHNDIFAAMVCEYDLDVTGQLQLSPGLKSARFLSNCLLTAGGNMAIGAVGKHTSVAYELAVDAPITTVEAVIQWRYLFSDREGRRVMRVFSMSVRVSPDPRAVLASVDEGALAAVLARQAVAAVLKSGPVAARDWVTKDVRAILACGVRFGSLPQFMHALLSCEFMHPKLGYDWVMAEAIRWRSLNVIEALLTLYPRMICVDGGQAAVPLTATSFAAGNCFLVHMHSRIILWVASGAGADWLREAFGTESLKEIPLEVPTIATAVNADLNTMIEECWTISGRYLPVTIIPQGDPREDIFNQILVEDSTIGGAAFSEWMKEIGQIAV
jgi:hypothetical protein